MPSDGVRQWAHSTLATWSGHMLCIHETGTPNFLTASLCVSAGLGVRVRWICQKSAHAMHMHLAYSCGTDINPKHTVLS